MILFFVVVCCCCFVPLCSSTHNHCSVIRRMVNLNNDRVHLSQLSDGQHQHLNRLSQLSVCFKVWEMSAIIQPPFTIVFQCMGSMNIYPVTFLDCVFQGMDNIDELSCHLSQLSVCFMVWKMSAIIQPPFTIVCKFQGLVWTTSVNYPTTFHNFSVCFRVWTTSANYLVTFHNCL